MSYGDGTIYKEAWTKADEEHLKDSLKGTVGEMTTIQIPCKVEGGQYIKLSDLNPPEERHRNPNVDLTELSNSIEQEGLHVPIIITKDNEIVDGERRYLAISSKYQEDVEVPFLYSDDATDKYLFGAITNTVRRNPTKSEVAKVVKRYSERLTFEQIAGALGMSRKQVSKYWSLASLDEEILDAVDEGEIRLESAYLASTIEDPDLQEEIVKKARLGASDKQLRAMKKSKDPTPSRATSEDDSEIPPPPTHSLIEAGRNVRFYVSSTGAFEVRLSLHVDTVEDLDAEVYSAWANVEDAQEALDSILETVATLQASN